MILTVSLLPVCVAIFFLTNMMSDVDMDYYRMPQFTDGSSCTALEERLFYFTELLYQPSAQVLNDSHNPWSGRSTPAVEM